MSLYISDMRERLRKFMEHMAARSERSMGYWEKVPIHRLGDEYLKRTEELIKALTTGKGDVETMGMDIAFLCFLVSVKGPEIKEILSRTKGADIQEIRVNPDEEQEKADRAAWEQKKKGKTSEKGREDWRG